jgi:iron complex transport system ATP-binding protein
VEIMLKVCGVHAGYGGEDILNNVSFSMEKGEFVCILGSNGCGKTTLLKTILGLIPARCGKVLFLGEDIHKMREKDLAKKIAYIPQAHNPPFPFTVEDVVLMGRTPYLNKMSRVTQKDLDVAENAMEQIGILPLAKRRYTELSGGQRQMVIIARALAQEPELLIMDEPTASLDFGNQYITLEQMARLSKAGMSVLMVTHNPDHALYCAYKTIIMRNGEIVEIGKSKSVINEISMQKLYNTEIKMAAVQLSKERSVSVCVPVPNLETNQIERWI